ncbi:cuticle protein 10.9 [Trichonephila clavata]|uniref:Cuticle protein 10.9 n=1 Tax=Trichonephila clavata TaxID=2740835 RepID=A0A8X6L7G7_TRICU|nr:cuticle protein 10.9 [Trichonephila clavata]
MLPVATFVVIVFCACAISVLNSAILPGQSSQVPIDTEPVILVNPANAYIFGYESDDGLGTTQHRHEVADGSGVVKGSYGYRDSFGVFRSVNYTADGNGYRAVVRSNEPGFTGQSSSDVVYVAEPPVPIRAPPLAVRVKKSEK